MAGSPSPAGSLADGAHDWATLSWRPGSAPLRLFTTHARDGILDGAWWPRSRTLAAELPALVSALTERLGPVTRIGLDRAAWDELPTRLNVDGRVVNVDSFPVGDDTVLVTRGHQDIFSLLVVPPDTPSETARTAMAEAVRTGNSRQARQILTDAGVDRARRPGRRTADDSRRQDRPPA
ncbi:DUF5994 family protein [Streptomyces olivaceus]|uniref:DUF5994 family protein n=1 Tax=Streptomyces olivaceus TaxID=47716 RepID=UPI001CCD238C|nr:DUF5994 family protein [Streptomyces olivaceus]